MKCGFLFVLAILSFSSGKSDLPYRQQERPATDSVLVTGWYFIANKMTGYERQLDRDSIIYSIDPRPLLTVKNITSMVIYEDNYGNYTLSMKLNEIGAKIFQQATFQRVGLQLAFIIADKLIYTPKVNEPIYNGIAPLNRGIYSKEDLEQFKAIIEKEKQASMQPASH